MALTPRLEKIVSETFKSYRLQGNHSLTGAGTQTFFSRLGINKYIPSVFFEKQVRKFLTDPRFSKTREDISEMSSPNSRKISGEVSQELSRKKGRFLQLVGFSQDDALGDLKKLSDSFDQTINGALESYVGSGYKTLRTYLHRKIDAFVEQTFHFPNGNPDNQDSEIFYEKFIVPFVLQNGVSKGHIPATMQDHPDILKRLIQNNFHYFESNYSRNGNGRGRQHKFGVWDYLRTLDWFLKKSEGFRRTLGDLLICKKALEKGPSQTDYFEELERRFKYSHLKSSLQETLLSKKTDDIMGSSQSFEDADQEFRIFLARVASKYEGRNLASFKTFLNQALRNEIISRYWNLETDKRRINQSVYLASSLEEGEDSYLARKINNFLTEEFCNFEGNPYSFGNENMHRLLWARNCPIEDDRTTKRLLFQFRAYLHRRKGRLSARDLIPSNSQNSSTNKLYSDLVGVFGEDHDYFLQPFNMELLSGSEHPIYSIFGAPIGWGDKAEFITLCLKTPIGYKIPNSFREFNFGLR